MSELKEYKLGELFEIPLRNGLNKPSRVRGSGVRMVNMKEIFGYDFIGNETPMELVPLVKNEEETCSLREGDLLFARQSLVASGAGKVAYYRGNLPTVFESHLIRCRFNKEITNSKFLYYLIKSPQGRGKIETIVEQTAAAGIRGSDLKELIFSIPDLPTQTAIAEILSSLDDKIELNNQINKDLEALAQALFKQWFIDFEFPNENGEPYRSSGGEMVESEFGRIPQGWKIDLLNTVFDFLEGPGLRNWQYTNEGMPFINIRLIQNGDINTEKSSYISKQEFETKYRHFELHEFDFVVSTSGTLGKSAIVRTKHLPLMLNTSVIRFKPLKQNSKCFMYQYLQSESFLEELRTQASGSVQLNFGPMHLNRINMIIPAESVIQNYEELFDNVYQKIISNREENNSLATLRDTLLPKLISGELEVSDIQTKTL